MKYIAAKRYFGFRQADFMLFSFEVMMSLDSTRISGCCRIKTSPRVNR